MSDSAFPAGKYPSYGIDEIRSWIAAGRGNPDMVAEVARREAIAAGDVSQMTPGERLRRLRTS